MRFLLAAQKQNTRRLRIEQLILLLVRVGVIALIVLAMASVTPWAENLWAAIWPEGGRPAAPQGSRIHHVIVLDGSLSMNLTVDGQSVFERARQLALAKIKQAAVGDGFSVLLMRQSYLDCRRSVAECRQSLSRSRESALRARQRRARRHAQYGQHQAGRSGAA